MKTLPKILLVASAITFALSLTEPGIEIWFGIVKPVSALLFVVAFIIHVVASLDPAEYAADNALRNRLIEDEKAAGKPSVKVGERERKEALAT